MAIVLLPRLDAQEARHAEHEWDYGKEHGPAHWGADDARPTQPLYDRVVKETR